MEEEDVTLPDWLPDGWIMEVRKGKRGFTYRYYTCPISDYTFCSKEDVIRYLNNVNVSRGPVVVKRLKDKDHQSLLRVKDALQWLPHGWIMEIRTRQIKEGVEDKYKCYFHRSTGSTCNSKEEVLQFLKMGNAHVRSMSTRKHRHTSEPNNIFVLSRIEYSPCGLPDGWIKEVKFRRNPSSFSHTRQDPYYTDTESGYVFRTLKDCFLYIEHGILSKYAYKPKSYSICDDILLLGHNTSDSSSPKKLKSNDEPISQVKLGEPDEKTDHTRLISL